MRDKVQVVGIFLMALGVLLGLALTMSGRFPSGSYTRPINTQFDPFKNLEPRYQKYASAFVRANSRAEIRDIKRRIDRELADKAILRRAGGGGTGASLIATILSPELWLIVVGATMAFRYKPVVWGIGIVAGAYHHVLLELNSYTGRDIERIAISMGAGLIIVGLSHLPILLEQLRRKLPN